ncbi:MAG: universal stress protein [Hyphomicrobiaceae bacterium]
MKNSFLLAIDGSSGSENAVGFAIDRAKRGGADIIVAYVIEWSPYSFNTPEENETRHKRREEELERATTHVVEPVAAQIKAAGVNVATEVRHGHTAATLIELAKQHDVAQIFIGRRGQSGLQQMVFGSVTANLVQSATVPVTVVP